MCQVAIYTTCIVLVGAFIKTVVGCFFDDESVCVKKLRKRILCLGKNKWICEGIQKAMDRSSIQLKLAI
jgi:hypothetical protein